MSSAQMVQRCAKLEIISGGAVACVLPRMHIGKCVRDWDGGVNIGWRLERHDFEGGGKVCARCYCLFGHPVHKVLPAAA